MTEGVVWVQLGRSAIVSRAPSTSVFGRKQETSENGTNLEGFATRKNEDETLLETKRLTNK